MNFVEVLKDPQWWRALLGSDFNQGFMAALALILALMVILLILRGIIGLMFRTRRCSCVVVRRSDGDTVVSRDTLEALVNRELALYPAIRSTRLLLTRRRGAYQVTIYCEYLLSDHSGIPAFCDEFKPKLQEALKRSFGFTELSGIRLWVEAPAGGGDARAEDGMLPVTENNAYTGL